MINTVVFDLGKVLVAFDWEQYLTSFDYDEHTYEAIADAVFRNDDWEYGDTGAVNGEEWLTLFIANAPNYEQEIRCVYESLGECIYPYAYTSDWVGTYRDKGYRVFYLSNYSQGLYEKTKAQLSFLDMFDGGVFSFLEKCIKPDYEIYKKLIERYAIVPEETLFFDDRKENIQAAKKLGFQGHVFTKEVLLKELSYKMEEA